MGSRQPLFANCMAVFQYLTPNMAIPTLLPNTQKKTQKDYLHLQVVKGIHVAINSLITEALFCLVHLTETSQS